MVTPIKPVPDWRVYVVVCPMISGGTGHMYVQDHMMDALGHHLREMHWHADVLYALRIYAKPPKSADMVEMLKRGIPIE